MKQRFILELMLCFGFAMSSTAQNTNWNKDFRQQTEQTKRTNKAGTSAMQSQNNGEVSLTSTSANQAYGKGRGDEAGRRFSIADPTINVLNQRANGSNVLVGSSGIVGMPKRTYGFANGKILLRSTTATTSGTVYGSGAVGTGTTIMGVGTGENIPGINGKNPYAGPWLWGTKTSGLVTPTAADKGNKPMGKQ